MIKLDNALEQLVEIVLQGEEEKLERIYLTIKSEVELLIQHVEALKIEKEELEVELEERKEIMWNNPNFREQLVRQIVGV